MSKISVGWRPFRNVLRCLGFVLLVGMLWWLGPKNVLAQLSRADGGLLLCAVGLIVPLIGLKVTRWALLLRCNGLDYPFSKTVLVYCGGLFLGFFTPGRAGELAKALPVSRQCGVSIGKVLPSVLADRLFDVYVLLMFALGGLVSVAAPGSGPLLIAALAILGGVSLSLWPLMSQKVIARLEAWSLSLGTISQKIVGLLRTLHEGLHEIRGLALGLALLLTVAAYVVFFTQCYLVARALDLNLPLGQLVVAVSAGNIAGFLPISISNIGTREAVLVAYLTPLGTAPDQALGFSLLLFVVFNLSGAALGAVSWWFVSHQTLDSLVDQVSKQPNTEQDRTGRQQQ